MIGPRGADNFLAMSPRWSEAFRSTRRYSRVSPRGATPVGECPGDQLRLYCIGCFNFITALGLTQKMRVQFTCVVRHEIKKVKGLMLLECLEEQVFVRGCHLACFKPAGCLLRKTARALSSHRRMAMG